MSDRLRKADFSVHPCSLETAQALVEDLHYSKGGSNTAVYVHGLFPAGSSHVVGVAWWLPPTRVAAESVNRDEWQRVLSLTRLVVKPGVPANACSFLMARSIRQIRRDSKWVSLVTYADESQGHTGAIYRAANWTYVGKMGPYPRWIEPVTGRQVSPKATENRTKAQMQELGYEHVGSYYKHKFVMHLKPHRRPTQPRLFEVAL